MSATEINERSDFIGIDKDVRVALEEARPVVLEALPDALDDFYALIARTPSISDMMKSGEVKSRARNAQESHWDRLLKGEIDEQYGKTVKRIGLAHANLGLEPRYFVAGYANVAADLLKHLITAQLGLGVLPAKRAKALRSVDALIRVLMLDMEMAITAYLDERDAKAKKAREQIAQDLEATVGETAAALIEAATSLDTASASLASAIEATTSQVASAAAGSEEASANVRSVAAASTQLGAASKEIAGQASQQSSGLREAVEYANNAATVIGELGDASGEIGSVISLIEEIAEKTNLLALNATIEAARAGEAGKGFAVVASEVKDLASQTAKATDQITGQVNAMQSATDGAVKAVEAITATVEQISQAAVAIEAAVEEQSASISEISRNSEEAASGNQAASEAVAGVEERARESSEASTTVATAASSVRSGADQLQSRLAELIASVRAA